MSSSIINEILQKSDIFEVVSEFINLSKVGKNYKGICTVHNDTTPSLSVSQEKQVFKCFSCGISGNVITFLEKFQNMSKKETIIYLAKKYNLDSKKFEYIENSRYNDIQKKIIKVFDDITQKFSYDLTFKENIEASEFLKSRHLNSKIQNMFSIGYAKSSKIENYKDFLLKKDNDISTMINSYLLNEKENPIISNRIIFPIKNEFGDIVGLSSRSLNPDEKNYKYINSGDSVVFNKSTIIYNYWRAKEVGKEIYLVEGFMDVIAFARVNLNNAVALMGTSISEIHTSKLKNNSVTLFFDSDQAGFKATIKSIFLLLKAKIDVSIVNNNSSYDPDEFLNKNGEEAFVELLNNKISGIEFIYQHLINSIEISNSNNIKYFIKKFNNYLIFCEPIIKSQYLNKISILLKIELSELSKIFNIFFEVKNKPSKINYENIEINQQKNNKIKNTYIFININRLLLGMLRNQKFTEIYLDENVFLGTSEYTELARYIINKKKNIDFIINEELERKLRGIERTQNPPQTKEEFLETIKNIEKEKVHIKLSQNNKKLKNTVAKNPDDGFVSKILQSSIEVKNKN